MQSNSRNKKIVILGAGESGTGAAILAKKQGFDVFVSDSGQIAPAYTKELNKHQIPFEQGLHTEAMILAASTVVKSPGIPDDAAIIQKLRDNNIPYCSEIEFAYPYTRAKMICITGSNGKTTTTLLTYHLLKKAGLNVGLAGNVGHSLARQVAENNFDYFVLELSSFQLDGMYRFKAHIAVLLNITPDHLDRYGYKMENYVRSKFRIAQNQTGSDFFIYCLDDEETMKELPNQQINAKKIPFTIKQQVSEGACLVDNQLTVKLNTKLYTMSIAELALQGKHNIYNSMAASIIGRSLELGDSIIRESLSDFQNVEHRLEHVAKIQGIEFINDSKATNVNSVWYALESMNTPVIWIVGGVDKGNDYSILKDLVKEKVKAIVCLGKDNKKIHDAFEEDVEVIVNTFSAAEAVNVAYHLGAKGDTVLLSPACASFDLFKNYEDRGAQFKQAVKEL